MINLTGIFTALVLFLLPSSQPSYLSPISSGFLSSELSNDHFKAPIDTLVNYCALISAAYFYGQKSTENNPSLSEADVKHFNERWKQVFNIEFYQTGISNTEFSTNQRFKDGNKSPFPPSVLYNDKNPDTYLLFHLAEEVGKIKSAAFQKCPGCINESINKINELLKDTKLQPQVAQVWLGTTTLKKFSSVRDITDFWLFLRCLTIDDWVNPKSQPLLVSLPPVVKCPDTTIIECKDEIKPKVFVGYRHCEIGGKVDTIGPMIVKGIDNCPGTLYRYKFVARDQCFKKDSAYQYFRIKNDGPALVNPPYDTIVECIEYYRVHKLKGTSSCNLPVKVKTIGPRLVSGKHNCPYAVYEMQYIAHDTCDRDYVFKQKITIQNDDPLIECPEDTMVECIEYFMPGHPKYTLSCYEHYAELTTSTPILIHGRANCDGAIYVVTYTLIDSCDRKATCIQHITIHHGPPEIECPPNQEVLCEEDIQTSEPRSVRVFCNLGYDIHISDPVLIIGKPNCTGAVYSVTYTITDACGGRDSCEQLFTILQPEVLIDCPDDVVVMCEKDIKPTDPTISIACKRHYKVTHSDLKWISGRRNCDGAIYSITYTVKDDCGVIKTCEQKFIIVQPEPELVCPPEVTVDCDNLHTFDVPVPAIGCGLGYTSSRADPEVVSGIQDCDGSRYKVTYTITDECGRSATCDLLITLHVPMPQIWCAKNENVDCVKDIKATDPRVKTACNHTCTITHTAPILTKGPPDCAGAEYKITYTVTEDCGRELKCDQFFTITHGTINIGCPPDQEINCKDEIFEDPPTVQWGCKEGKVTHTAPYLETGIPNCPGAVYAVRYTATDQCQTSAVCVQRFTIRDNGLTITCPNDTIVLNPTDIRPSKVYVTSLCDAHPKVITSKPWLVEGVAGTDGAVYQIDYTITDDCQRTVECYQRFTLLGADCDSYPGTTAKWDDAKLQWVCVCDEGFEWDQVQNQCVPLKPYCAQFPGSMMVWNKQQGKYECQCPTGYKWNDNRTACELEVPDCASQYANSYAVLNPQTNTYECQCLTGYEWNTAGTACVLSVPDCASQYANSYAVLNPQTNTYECQCLTGYVWNTSMTACELQVPDCNSIYPNSTAVWNAQKNQYDCACLQGYVWNSSMTACELQAPDCNSIYPNSTAVWNAQKNQYDCACLQGYVWNTGMTACVLQAPDCNSIYPNSTAVWNAQKNQYECACLQGYVWNATMTGCDPAAPDCNTSFPNSIARFNYSTNQYECICLLGYEWNSTRTACVLAAPDCNSYYPNTVAVWNAQKNQYECNCIQGYEWNETIKGCVVSTNRDNPPVNPQQQKTGECSVQYGSGADEPEQYTIDVHSLTGTLQFSYNLFDVKDRIHVYYGGGKIFDTGCVGGSGNQSFTLNGYNSVFTIIVDPKCEPNDQTTSWNFTLGCPQ